MQQPSLFMMIHPNACEYASRSTFARKPKISDAPATAHSPGSRLENSPKDSAFQKQKRGKDSGHRAGDWICNVCNNHNYSFREVCNSCKTQTKLDNLRQALSILTAAESPSPDPPKPPSQKKRLQLKSGQEFEMSLKEGFKVKKSSLDSMGSCQEFGRPPTHVPPPAIPTERGLFQAFEDSFNEFPFEKACIFDPESCPSEKDPEETHGEGDSMELDKETLKMLSLDQE